MIKIIPSHGSVTTQEVVELDDATFSKLSPSLLPTLNQICRELDEKVRNGRMDHQSYWIVLHALGALSKGERFLFPQLIHEYFAGMILGMDVNALRKSKFLRPFRHNNEIFLP